jgi:hypothetical protein
VAGLFAGIGKGGGEFLKQWNLAKAKKLQESLKTATTLRSNGTLNQNVMNDLAAHPERYTPEAVKGSQEKLVDFVDSIYGTNTQNPFSTRQLKGGVAKEAIEPLNIQADLEIERLSHVPEANFTVDELIGAVKKRTESLAKKKHKTLAEEKAVSFLRSEVDQLKAAHRVPKPQSSPILDPSTGRPFGESMSFADEYTELKFREGRDWLKRLQNAAYDEGPVKDNAIVKGIAHDMKLLADKKAYDLAEATGGEVTSSLPQINNKRSAIMSDYANLQKMAKDGTIRAAYVGKDSGAKVRLRRQLETTDKLLGTNLAEGAETLGFQTAVESLYQSPSAFGSGHVLKDIMSEGLTQAKKSAAKGFGLGAAAGAVIPGVGSISLGSTVAAGAGAVGLAKGMKRGAQFSSPDSLVKNFSKIKTRIDDIAADPTALQKFRQTMNSITANAAVQSDPYVRDYLATPAQSVQPPMAPPPDAQGAAQAPNQEQAALPPELESLDFDLPEDRLAIEADGVDAFRVLKHDSVLHAVDRDESLPLRWAEGQKHTLSLRCRLSLSWLLDLRGFLRLLHFRLFHVRCLSRDSGF